MDFSTEEKQCLLFRFFGVIANNNFHNTNIYFQMLLTLGFDINLQWIGYFEGHTDITILCFVALKGYVETGRLLIDNGADVTKSDSMKWTPLHYACYCGHYNMVQLLVQSGAPTRVQTIDNCFPRELAQQSLEAEEGEEAEQLQQIVECLDELIDIQQVNLFHWLLYEWDP